MYMPTYTLISCSTVLRIIHLLFEYSLGIIWKVQKGSRTKFPPRESVCFVPQGDRDVSLLKYINRDIAITESLNESNN